MDLMGTIWDEHVFGLTFDGKRVNVDGDAFRVDEKTPLILFGSLIGGDIQEAKDFFRKRGFYINDYYDLSEKTKAEIEDYLASLESKETCVVILTKDRQLRACEALFKKYGIHFQLFSRVQWFFNLFRPNLWKAYQLLEDDYSKEVYTVSLGVHYKILPEKAIWPYYDPNQYFSPPEMFAYDGEEIFVDCGAFVGDTVENFIRSRGNYFKRIYAFEPGPQQYKALLQRVKRLCVEWALDEEQIRCVPSGVGSCSAKLEVAGGEWYEDMGAMRLVKGSNEGGSVQVVDLDTYLASESKIGFIKADIEGFEMEMLQGAKKIIQRDKPRLAITLYHKLTDYYEVPLYVKNIVPDYKLKVLHHSFKFPETVLYAYIE